MDFGDKDYEYSTVQDIWKALAEVQEEEDLEVIISNDLKFT